MDYPLSLSFKIFALAPQIRVTNASGALVCYVKQKLFKLKEAVNVFADEQQTQLLCKINADRVLDISARYHFTDAENAPLGSVKRQGLRSIWKAHYDILDGESVVMTIREENPWIKVFDHLLGEIPILGMFTGYLFHPSYLVTRQDGVEVMRCQKESAFFEGKFKLEKLADMDEGEELRVLLSFLMMLLLERQRG